MRIFPMNCNRFIGNFTAASGCFQLVPKYKLEVKLIKNTVEPMFVHEMTKKIANNLKGWSVSLNILIRPFAEVQK